MSTETPFLYVKPGCPWCTEVVNFLSANGIRYLEKNVSADATAREEMIKLSGQTKVPVLNWHGAVLADFGVQELRPFLREHKVAFAEN